jgi:hypothetical protein
LCTATWTSCAFASNGGTQSTGGAAGVGANATGSNSGGGGGGYFGGTAAAANAGGAGGSSYTANGVSSVTHTSAVNTTARANGSLTITTTVDSLAPTNLTVAGFSRSVDLSWTPWPFDAVTGYRVKWGTDPAALTNQFDVNAPASGARHQSMTPLSITTRALTSNVATLTSATAHGLAVNDVVVVEGVGAPFNGTVTVTAVPTSTTFKYAATSATNISARAKPCSSATSTSQRCNTCTAPARLSEQVTTPIG